MNRRSGRVLGPTYRISSSRAAPSLPRLVGVTGSLGEGMSDIPDRWSGVRSPGAVAPTDDELVLEDEPELSVTFTQPYRASFSESDGLLLLKIKKKKSFTFSDVLGACIRSNPFRQSSAVFGSSRQKFLLLCDRWQMRNLPPIYRRRFSGCDGRESPGDGSASRQPRPC